MLFAVAEPGVRALVRDAHDHAVREALGYVERSAASVRRGHAGAEVLPANGLVAAAFRHRTSRAGDPQLHTHLLVANLGQGPDQRWSALDGRRLYAHARAASFLYQAVLRAELTAALGIEWSATRAGIAEIRGISPRVLRAFSRRRAEIEASLAEHGTEGPRASEAAALATRQAKDRGIDPERLAGEWRERAAALGLVPERANALLGRARPRQLDAETIDAVVAELTCPAGLTLQRSSFTRREVIEALCDRLPSGARVDARTLEALADRLLASERVVPLVGPRNLEEAGTFFRRRDGRALPAAVEERRYSTPEFLALEQRLIGRALASRDAGVGVAQSRHLERALRARPTLSAEQAQMVRALAAGGAGVAVVVGRAGAGKTFALAACHDAWARSGFPVLGAAVARHAAQQLQAETAIPSTSMAALIADLQRGERLPPRVVLVVDEAGMAGTRQLATALDHVEAAGGKLVLVGDDRQLPAIEAGGAFAALARRGLAVELAENRRQTLAWEREAVDHLRAGRAEQALALYRDHDRLVVEPDVDAARERLVDDWWAVRDPEGSIMIALRRADVAELNERARQRMRSEGALGHDELDLPGGHFAVGDHVLVRQNHVQLGVSNGERAVVTEIDVEQHRLEIALGGRRVTLGRGFLDARTARGDPPLTHGYAITGHAAQGTTVDRAFVLADPALTQEWGYTALTRGRDANHLYLAATRSLWRDEYAPRDPEPPDPIAQLARALSTSRVQTLAIDASSVERTTLAEARLALERLQSEQADAARVQRLAGLRRGELEGRSTRWRPRLRRELERARAADRASWRRIEDLRVRAADQARRVHALTLSELEPERPRADRQARALQRRLERGTEREVGRGLER